MSLLSPHVSAVALPQQSRLSPRFATSTLADAFAIRIPTVPGHAIDAWAQAALGHPTRWFRALLSLRDLAVGGLGLKTTAWWCAPTCGVHRAMWGRRMSAADRGRCPVC